MSGAGLGARTDEVVRQEAIAWLARLRAADGGSDHAAFEDWYMADPRHADIYDEVLANWEAMEAAARTPAAQAGRKPVGRFPARLAAWTAVAAAFAAALLLLPGHMSQPARTVTTGKALPTHFVSGAREIRSVRLPDGSEVTLDANSRLSLLFTKDERRLRLDSGRARFRVAHGDPRQFVVEARDAMIVAHGTVFDVDLGRSRVAVALLEVSVEVRQTAAGPAADERMQPTVLKPGQSLIVAQRATPQHAEPEDLRWTPAMLSFDDAELGDVVMTANRFNETKIVLVGPSLATRRFSGTFSTRDPLAFAQTLSSMFDLTIARDGDGTIRLEPSSKPEK